MEEKKEKKNWNECTDSHNSKPNLFLSIDCVETEVSLTQYVSQIWTSNFRMEEVLRVTS